MQVVVTIPDELAAQVRARGVSPETFVNRLIEDASRAAQNGSTSSPRRHLDEFFGAMAANSGKIPQLPDAAFARASFYRDRD
jgi:hypothetical protein